jgi:hypothetical protein
LAVNHLSGTLAGEAADPERLWIMSPDGQRVSIVWPEGYSVRFEPSALLFDERGMVVARAGDKVEFGQVSIGEHAGTTADPYWATGLVFDGCYVAAR